MSLFHPACTKCKNMVIVVLGRCYTEGRERDGIQYKYNAGGFNR